MKKLISHILIALTGMLAVSCNAWLDVTPENAIADDDLFSTGFGYRNALNGIYTNLASDELYGKQLSCHLPAIQSKGGNHLSDVCRRFRTYL